MKHVLADSASRLCVDPSFLVGFTKIPGWVDFKKNKFREVAMNNHLTNKNTLLPSIYTHWFTVLRSSWRNIFPILICGSQTLHLKISYRGQYGKHEKGCRQSLAAKTSPWLAVSKETKALVLQQQGTKSGQQSEWASPGASTKNHSPANTQF